MYKKTLRSSYGTYIGDVKDNKKDGKGLQVWINNKYGIERYEGDWKDNNMYKKGKITYTNGNIYEGEILQIDRDLVAPLGKGIMIYAFGDKYEGEMYRNWKQGNGIMTYRNGDIYDGEWKEDEKYGKGIMIYANGDKYEGKWINNNKSQGIMMYVNGDKYEGEWKNYVKHGNGIMIYANGDKYNGDWLYDTRHGTGTITYANGEIYEGRWNLDKKHGTGKLIINNIEYSGQWDNDIYPKDPSIKSLKIISQGLNGTCWAHAICRTFIRTLQILDVIQSPYVDQFHLLFFYILLKNKDNKCLEGSFPTENMFFLLNYLKEINNDDIIFTITYNDIKCYDINIEEGKKNDIILNEPSIIDLFIHKLKILFDNNLLFIANDSYNLHKHNGSKPTSGIKTMLDYRLQPYLGFTFNNYVHKIISSINSERTDIFPLVPKLNSFKEDDYKCYDSVSTHGVNLRRWMKTGIEFKNSWGINIASEGNFSVPTLKYLTCKRSPDVRTSFNINVLHFYVLMFDYNNLPLEIKEIVQINIKKYKPLIDGTLDVIENKRCNYNDYNFLDGNNEKCEVIQDIGFFKGNFNNGIRDGHGVMKFISHGVYDGNWKDDTRHGQGVMTYRDGRIYDGNWKDDKRHGQGVLTYPTGDVYNGNWKDGKYDGQGIMTYSTGHKYDGNWKDDERHGQGTMRYPNGDIYDGNWKDGGRHDHGIMTYSYGHIYDGNWKDNERHGHGIIKLRTGHVQYDGEWLNNMRNGHGILNTGDIYDGEWLNDKRHGKGIYTNLEGDVYDGQWLNDMRHGHGTKRWINGDVYEGEWLNDNRHGRGRKIWVNGDVYEGNWENNKRHGHGKMINRDNVIISEGEWNNDVFVEELGGHKKYLKYKKKYLELKYKNHLI